MRLTQTRPSRKLLRSLGLTTLGVAWAAAVGCGISTPVSPSPTGDSNLTFSVAPLDIAAIDSIVPLGNLNPPGHTLPTSHMYINNHPPGSGPAAPTAILAPADGVVQFIRSTGTEAQVGIQVGASFTYYFAHVLLDGGIMAGSLVRAGQRLGTTSTTGAAVDFGLINSRVTLWFANPLRYPVDTTNGDAPLKYFAEPLRSALYSKVRSLGNPDGKFDFDVAGRLVGNWFLEGLSPAASSSSDGWPGLLAFVYDNYDPSSVRISVGGTLSVAGVFGVPNGSPDPRTISQDTGPVTYRLLRTAQPGAPLGAQAGLLVVQMLDEQRLLVEDFADTTGSAASFSPNARVYVR